MSQSIFNNQMRVPNEILMQIFNHLDSRSLIIAGSVCKKWSSIVQMVHDKAWRSLTKAVQLKPRFIGPKYKKIGWVKKVHSWYNCKCINISRDLAFYDDIELMAADVKQVKKLKKEFEYEQFIIEHVEEAEAIIRLVAAGIMTTHDELSLTEWTGIDWSIVKNLNLLVKIVHGKFSLQLNDDLTGELPKSVFNHINCETLIIQIMFRNNDFRIFTETEIEGVTKVLNDRVKTLALISIYGYSSFFSIIEKYDGKGKCKKIKLNYPGVSNEEFVLEFEKIKEWANSRGWNVRKFNGTMLEIYALQLETNWRPLLRLNGDHLDTILKTIGNQL